MKVRNQSTDKKMKQRDECMYKIQRSISWKSQVKLRALNYLLPKSLKFEMPRKINCIFVCVCVCVCERERERERNKRQNEIHKY